MSEIREEDGSDDREPDARGEGGAVAGVKEEPGPLREPPGCDQPQQEQEDQKRKGKKKRILRRARTLLSSSIKRIESLQKTRGGSRSSSGSNCCPSSNSYPVYFGDEPMGCCYLCFLPPPAADSPPGPRGPSGNTSSYGFVKNLIERNDFYDPDCNVHRDV